MKAIIRRIFGLLLICLGPAASASELGYDAYIDSPKRIKCMYGYVTAKTGNFDVARQIFEDCIARWNDVYSMIWLAQMYESGSGVPVDLDKAAALMERGANQPDEASYVSLARYHWGTALAEGRGVKKDPKAARMWLERASEGGQSEADEYLLRMD
ncbi:tetratricopeptide repeat protein [Stutzerimonas zhaodongensis]|jgi:TPR repeat protein|uniref:Sel1 repeat family protein n=1 Tax=Stutzerimonas zhaodongensis TaxID=1176257 RepID=A0A365PQY0_9GAMM|nr:tetratricopeptide repeat protein [Stutzerimonas zhaodongensis]QWV15921.1 sel1 repeat family protein [Stutzerimonas zhaodongensis]RBA54248.1 sel1 repeat family protein [Stutzerimonas zhaodongensis]